jgi:hypothetical protein
MPELLSQLSGGTLVVIVCDTHEDQQPRPDPGHDRAVHGDAGSLDSLDQTAHIPNVLHLQNP